MASELARIGHPMLATLLTVGLASMAQAEPALPEAVEPRPEVALTEELELLKEEETVSIASRYEQPISQAASNVYVITDEDIRQSGATDLPTVLRRIPGMEVMQTTGADFNVSMRGDIERQQVAGHGGRAIHLCRCACADVLEGDPRHSA
jgi:iron complex outermembrane receptor protein